MDHPRIPPALRQVLAAHDDPPVTLVAGDVVVDVLRGVGLAVHQETTVTKANVLNENGIDGLGGFADICRVQVPKPSGVPRMQRERYAVAEAARLVFPNKTVAGGAEPALGARPGYHDADGRGAANAQIQP